MLDPIAVLEEEVALRIIEMATAQNLEGRTKAQHILRVANAMVGMGITRESDDELFHLRVIRTHVLYGQYFEAENSLGNLHKLKTLTLENGQVILPSKWRLNEKNRREW